MRISDWSSDVCSSDLSRESRHLPSPAIVLRALPLPGVSRDLDRQSRIEHGIDDSVGRRRMADDRAERKIVVSGKSVYVRVDLGGRRLIQKKHIRHITVNTFICSSHYKYTFILI